MHQVVELGRDLPPAALVDAQKRGVIPHSEYQLSHAKTSSHVSPSASLARPRTLVAVRYMHWFLCGDSERSGSSPIRSRVMMLVVTLLAKSPADWVLKRCTLPPQLGFMWGTIKYLQILSYVVSVWPGAGYLSCLGMHSMRRT